MPYSPTQSASRLARAVACVVAVVPALAVGCGSFGISDAPAPPASSAATDAPTTTSGVDAGGPDTSLPDGAPPDAASGCAVSGSAAFDLAFGVDGILQLPNVTQPVAALGSAGALYVAGQENCGDADLEMALRKVPLNGSSAGAVVRCFDQDLESPVDLSGDPSSGYVLATRISAAPYRARLRRLNPDGTQRDVNIELGSPTLPVFAERFALASAPTAVDVWGYYSAPQTSSPTGGTLAFAGGASASSDGIPVSAASYPGNLVVASLRDPGEANATLVVKRFVVGSSSVVEDPSFGKQEQPVAFAQLGNYVSSSLVASPTYAALGVSGSGAGYVLLLEPSGPRPLAPTLGFGGPRLARRCDGTLAMATLEAGGNLVVTRYTGAKGDQLDPLFRATKKVSGTIAFLLAAPDHALIVGTTSGQLLRLLP